MVEKKTIFQEQIDKIPDEVEGDLNKLGFSYSARINTMAAKSCEGKEGNEFKQCFKDHSKLLSQIYSVEDYYSDNFNASRNNNNSMEKSIEIIKKILK
jgi:hypothetical protein